MLESIRVLEKDAAFANKVISIMLSENEVYKLKERAQWDENKLEWKIPLFYFNSKDASIQFPTINA